MHLVLGVVLSFLPSTSKNSTSIPKGVNRNAMSGMGKSENGSGTSPTSKRPEVILSPGLQKALDGKNK